MIGPAVDFDSEVKVGVAVSPRTLKDRSRTEIHHSRRGKRLSGVGLPTLMGRGVASSADGHVAYRVTNPLLFSKVNSDSAIDSQTKPLTLSVELSDSHLLRQRDTTYEYLNSLLRRLSELKISEKEKKRIESQWDQLMGEMDKKYPNLGNSVEHILITVFGPLGDLLKEIRYGLRTQGKNKSKELDKILVELFDRHHGELLRALEGFEIQKEVHQWYCSLKLLAVGLKDLARAEGPLAVFLWLEASKDAHPFSEKMLAFCAKALGGEEYVKACESVNNFPKLVERFAKLRVFKEQEKNPYPIDTGDLDAALRTFFKDGTPVFDKFIIDGKNFAFNLYKELSKENQVELAEQLLSKHSKGGLTPRKISQLDLFLNTLYKEEDAGRKKNAMNEIFDLIAFADCRSEESKAKALDAFVDTFSRTKMQIKEIDAYYSAQLVEAFGDTGKTLKDDIIRALSERGKCQAYKLLKGKIFSSIDPKYLQLRMLDGAERSLSTSGSGFEVMFNLKATLIDRSPEQKLNDCDKNDYLAKITFSWVLKREGGGWVGRLLVDSFQLHEATKMTSSVIKNLCSIASTPRKGSFLEGELWDEVLEKK